MGVKGWVEGGRGGWCGRSWGLCECVVACCECLVFELYLKSVGFWVFGFWGFGVWCWRGGRVAWGMGSAGMEVRVWVMRWWWGGERYQQG